MAATTPAKRAPRARAATPKPAPARPRVTLDLDTLSKDKVFPDKKLPRAPFTFLLTGTTYELADPRDSDWKMALHLAQNPFLLMRSALVDADEPVDDPTPPEMESCRERHGLPAKPPAQGSEQAAEEALLWPDGVSPGLIDRFTASYLPAWKLNALFSNWHQHYQIELKDGQGILSALLGTQ